MTARNHFKEKSVFRLSFIGVVYCLYNLREGRRNLYWDMDIFHQ